MKMFVAAALASVFAFSTSAFALDDLEATVVRNGEPVILRACEFSQETISDLDCLKAAAQALQNLRATIQDADATSVDTLLVDHLEMTLRMAAMSVRMMNYDSRTSDVAEALLMRTEVDVKAALDKVYDATKVQSASASGLGQWSE